MEISDREELLALEKRVISFLTENIKGLSLWRSYTRTQDDKDYVDLTMARVRDDWHTDHFEVKYFSEPDRLEVFTTSRYESFPVEPKQPEEVPTDLVERLRQLLPQANHTTNRPEKDVKGELHYFSGTGLQEML